MNRVDYYFFDRAVEKRVWMHQLLREPERHQHDLSNDGLLKLLKSLFDQHDLSAYWLTVDEAYEAPDELIPSMYSALHQEEFAGEFSPSLADLRAALEGFTPVKYGLTAQGGAKWEAIAKPNWSRYLTYAVEEMDEDEAEDLAQYGVEAYQTAHVTASTDSLVEEFIDRRKMVFDIAMTEASWDVLFPWQATYWKTLPMGFSATYEFDFRQDGLADADDERRFRERMMHFLLWKKSVHDEWYFNPFQ